MALRHFAHVLLVAIALVAGPASAGETVEGLIEGTILMHGKPVQGVRIWWCRDERPPGGERSCNEFAGGWTDAAGRFSFRMRTGYTPPSPEECQKPFNCSMGDPGWSYWFVVETQSKRLGYWNGGLGYGVVHAEVICQLWDAGSFPRKEELECTVPKEDHLVYRR